MAQDLPHIACIPGALFSRSLAVPSSRRPQITGDSDRDERVRIANSNAGPSLTLLLCCILLSLAEGGSTTVVAWGFHLPSCCRRCCVIVRHHTQHIRHRNVRRNTQKSETIAEAHGNSAFICRVFWARSFQLSSGSTHISRFKHRCAAPPCVLRFWCFLLSPRQCNERSCG